MKQLTNLPTRTFTRDIARLSRLASSLSKQHSVLYVYESQNNEYTILTKETDIYNLVFKIEGKITIAKFKEKIKNK